MSERTSIERKTLFKTNYLFIDGMSRSGKFGIAPVISSLNNVEPFRNNMNYDRIMDLYKTGNLSFEGLIYFLESDLIMDTWFMKIGRNVNTNKHDLSSVINSSDFNKFKRRFDIEDTADSFLCLKESIEKERSWFPYCTEGFFPLAAEFPKYFSVIKFISVLRHPIEIIFSRHRSKQGERLGNDLRLPIPSFYKGEYLKLPATAVGFEKEYSNLNNLEKATFTVIHLMQEYLNALKKYSCNSYLFDFDYYSSKPNLIINKICDFLKTERSDFTEKSMIKCKVPRKLNNQLFKQKTSAVFANINEKLQKDLFNICYVYENQLPETPFRIDSVNRSNIANFIGINFSELTPQPSYKGGTRVN